MLLVSFMTVSTAAAADEIDIGSLANGLSVHGRDINDANVVVGDAYATVQSAHAFLWKNGAMEDLGTLGGKDSSAESVNESNQVVGWSHAAGEETHAFLWQNGTLQDLTPYLKSPKSYAYDINNHGQIVGMRLVGDEYRAFRLDLHTKVITDLGRGSAQAINDAGRATGYTLVGPGYENATIWNGNSPVLLKPLDGNTRSVGYDIDESGNVVGWSGYAAERQVATMWKHGVASAVTSDTQGASLALDTNNRGMAVGSIYYPATGQCAFVWSAGQATQPSTDDGCYMSANAINNKGYYIATSWDGKRTLILKQEINDDAQWHRDIVVGLNVSIYGPFYDVASWAMRQ